MSYCDIADLRARLTLQEEVRGGNNISGQSTWQSIGEVWGAIRTHSGEENVEAGQISGTLSHEVEIRYRRDISPAMRFKAADRVFFIFAVYDPDGLRRRLICLCEERDL